jgi:hypothetical protein
MESSISWTPGLPTKFYNRHGYDVNLILPLVAFGHNNINLQHSSPGEFKCVLDTEDQGLGYLNDFRNTLADCYQDYITTLSTWARETLGLGYSAQVSYNMPMEMGASIPFVDAPECESLQWEDNTDGYRQFSGAAYLSDKKIISNELGGVFRKAFSYTIPELLLGMNRAVSGGVNRFVIHGLSYSGHYPQTTWPGNVPFSYFVSDPYSPVRPDWDNGLKQTLSYMSRIQYVQQQGIPRVDIALYNKQSITNPVPVTIYKENDLLQTGT